MYTIEDLRNGKCAVINDGTLEELREVLRLAQCEFSRFIAGNNKYYYKLISNSDWKGTDDLNIPTQSVKDFLIKEEDNDPFDIYKNIYINRNSEISRRDYFAAMAMQGLATLNYQCFEQLSANSVKIADKIIAELDKTKQI